jgi:hypothetical protein
MSEQNEQQNGRTPPAEAAGAQRAGASTAGLPGGSAASGGMALSVTRHAQISQESPEEGKFRLLACGVDTLDLGLYVDWSENWSALHEELTITKAKAEQEKNVLWRTFGAADSVFHATGKPPQYRYHFEVPLGHIYLGKSGEITNTPNAYVSISARSLWANGVAGCYRELCKLFTSLGGKVLLVKPSRCDLCADFLIPGGLSDVFLSSHLVTRAGVDDVRRNDGILETYYRGSKKSPIQLRIYDKSKEVLAKGTKLWFMDIWGLSECVDVWRVEFQVRRVALKQFKINDLDGLYASLGSLWAYLTGEWVSVRLLDNPNPTRRTVHPWWQDVQSCAEQFGKPELITRQLRANTLPDADRYLRAINGLLIAYAAAISLPDFHMALIALARALERTSIAGEFFHRYRVRRVKWGWRVADVSADVAGSATDRDKPSVAGQPHVDSVSGGGE